MAIREKPHCRLQSGVLADWLERQGPTSWWSVDGDRLLTELLHFPCPSDELAAALRKIDEPLLLLPPGNVHCGDGQEASADDLNRLAVVDEQDRVFQLCWEHADPEGDWLLVEDVEVGKLSESSSSRV